MRISRRPWLAVALALLPGAASAWIYPEHRDIAVAGVQKLPPDRRAALDALWSEARKALPLRLCASPSEGDQGLKPNCIDFAAFPAMSGDHSCSPKEVAERTLRSKWILEVARVAEGGGAVGWGGGFVAEWGEPGFEFGGGEFPEGGVCYEEVERSLCGGVGDEAEGGGEDGGGGASVHGRDYGGAGGMAQD